MEHYFSKSPSSRMSPDIISAMINGTPYRFATGSGVFSKERVDRGTLLLAESVRIGEGDEVLDLGCGYGVIGIVFAGHAGSVVMTDINERAVELAKTNVKLNGLKNAEVLQCDLYDRLGGRKFDKIVCNPPIRAGKSVVNKIIEGAAGHLEPGGTLYLVARTKQGAKSIAKKMEQVFGNREYVRKGGGYRVMASRLTT